MRVLSVASDSTYCQSTTSAHRLSGGFVCYCLFYWLAVGFLGRFDMNKQQADYCDALSSGNIEAWKPGLMALMTIDEAVRWDKTLAASSA